MDARSNRRLSFAKRRASRRFTAFVLSTLALATSLTTELGCRAMNEDRSNTCVWFPTLFPPTKEEEAARRVNFPEGADPFVDAEVGPRSFNTRPKGCEFQRAKTADVLGVYPETDSKKTTTTFSVDDLPSQTPSSSPSSSSNGLNIAPIQ